MFDIGWTEMLVIAVVMIVVVGPKDLPRMLRTFGKTTAKLRVMAGDFQKQFNEALKEADLEEVKKSVNELRSSLDPTAEIKKQLNPFEKAATDIRTGLDAATQPKAPAVSPKNEAAATPAVAEPLPAIADAPVKVAAVKAKAKASAPKPKAAPRAKPAAKPVAKPAPAAKPKKAAAAKPAGTPK